MIKFIKSRYKIHTFAVLGAMGLLLLVGGISCCTITKRDTGFESKIQNFVDHAIPGSEMALLNGDTLGGWSVHGAGVWSVENGVLSVRRGLGYLATRCDSYTNVELSLECRISSYGNSGIFIRSQHPGLSIRPWPRGYEAQIENHTKKYPTGSVYNFKRNEQGTPNDNEWFSMKIVAVGETIQVFMNDQLSAETTDSTYHKGFIALQAHDPWSVVEFRNIFVRIPEYH
jgi:hypothetical protein